MNPHSHDPAKRSFGLQFGNDRLEYRPALTDDPVVSGRQLLEIAGATPVLEHLIFKTLPNGLLDELRPDETTHLDAAEDKRFIIFRSDRSFRFELDGRVFEWGADNILGKVLKQLANVDPDTHTIWKDNRGGEDQQIGNDEFASLKRDGTERFYTKQAVYRIVVNGEPKLWRRPRITYEELVALAFPGGPTGGNVRYCVSWTQPDGQEGSLRPGRSIDVIDGMIFHVSNTDKS